MSFYQSKRDGPIKEYIKKCCADQISPIFKGYTPYKMLWDNGYLEPQISTIRFYRDVGEDEHFLILGECEIEGINLIVHAGRPGIQNPRKLLSDKKCPPWETSNLNPHPKKRR